jgi:hypothetical protein
MENLDENEPAARSISPRAAAVFPGVRLRRKPEKHGTNDGKQLPSVGTGGRKAKKHN